MKSWITPLVAIGALLSLVLSGCDIVQPGRECESKLPTLVRVGEAVAQETSGSNVQPGGCDSGQPAIAMVDVDPHKKELNAFLKGYCTKKGGSPDLIQDGVLYLCKLRDLPDVEIWAPSAEPVNRLTISLRE